MPETILGLYPSTTTLICISIVSVTSGFIFAIILNQKLYRRYQSKQIELQLKQSRKSLEFALQSGRMGTWDVDLQSNSATCSPELLELWGIRPEEFTGERTMLQSKVHPDDRQKMMTALENAIQNDSIYEMEYRIRPEPGIERWVLSRGKCTFDPSLKFQSVWPVSFMISVTRNCA
jgi:PAS domain S-box-containing protein